MMEKRAIVDPICTPDEDGQITKEAAIDEEILDKLDSGYVGRKFEAEFNKAMSASKCTSLKGK